MKPELFLLHGWNMSPAAMLSFAKTLSTKFSVTLAVMPGYPAPGETESRAAGVTIASNIGNRPRTTPADSPSSLGELVSAIASQAPPQSHWVGWSLGATVALATAIQSPEKITSMALISPTPCFIAQPQWQHGFKKSIFEKLLRLTNKRYAVGTQQFLKLQFPSESEVAFSSALTTQLQHQPTGNALQHGFDILSHTDLRSALPQIPKPSMVIAANNDSIIPPAASKFVANHLPTASFELVGNGHALPLNHPQELAELIGTFVDGLAK